MPTARVKLFFVLNDKDKSLVKGPAEVMNGGYCWGGSRHHDMKENSSHLGIYAQNADGRHTP
jgi:hypothetical protein